VTARPTVAIVDYSLGNLFSIKQACAARGMDAHITSDPDDLERADGFILPGIGAFRDAITALRDLGLVDPIRRLIDADRPVLAICLGLQLLLAESQEFGRHQGLGIVPGTVAPLSEHEREGERRQKVPQVGWNRIDRPGDESRWRGSPLADVPDGAPMYFTHSFAAVPDDPDVVAATTPLGDGSYCSAIHVRSVYAYQFHPERSGTDGLRIYDGFASILRAGAAVR
jgi:glutamine amidotransferase